MQQISTRRRSISANGGNFDPILEERKSKSIRKDS